jgi:hypothetical protein
MTFKIHKFDPRVINEKRKTYGPATIAFIGSRGTGKTTLVADILYHIKDVPCGLVISGTEDGNGFYSKHVPDLFIHTDFDPEVLKQLVNRQKMLLHKLKNKDSSEEKVQIDSFLLLDDLAFDSASWSKDKTVRSIFMNGRWYRIFCLLTTQNPMDIPPSLRMNIDFVFVLKENIVAQQKKLYDHYFGMFENFNTFRQVITQCTENYECLVLDKTSKSNKIEDCVFWYKATPNRNFKIGSKALWDYHKSHYDNKHMLKDIIDKPNGKINVNVSKVGKVKNETKGTKEKKETIKKSKKN